ncbi:MAG: methyltransferase domain-containing protein, partial [Alteraurantiacibacter sp.]
RVILEGFGSFALDRNAFGADVLVDIAPHDFDSPQPFTSDSYDLVASAESLGTVKDLPGALIQMRALLAPGGLAMASFIGGASLTNLRRAMLAAEPERPAARMHPLVDPRSCTELLSRAGWADPVVDSFALKVRYGSLDRLVQDLREHAMTKVLATQSPPLTRDGVERARQAFLALADEDGKVSETFEIVTLTGRALTGPTQVGSFRA